MNQGTDALTERFDKSLFVLMQNLGPHLFARMQLGLTPGQIFMLYFIQHQDRCSVSKLAEKMEVAPSAITVMLDRLENHGFVSRMRDKEDRRVVLIELTDAGKAKLDEVLKARKQVTQHCFKQLDANELDSFVRTLEKLASIAQAMDVNAMMESWEKGR